MVNYKSTYTIKKDKKAFLCASIYALLSVLCAVFLAYFSILCVNACKYPLITICALFSAVFSIICAIIAIIDAVKKYMRI